MPPMLTIPVKVIKVLRNDQDVNIDVDGQHALSEPSLKTK